MEKQVRVVWSRKVPKLDFMGNRINHEFYYGQTASGNLEIMSPNTYGYEKGTRYALDADGKYYKSDK